MRMVYSILFVCIHLVFFQIIMFVCLYVFHVTDLAWWKCKSELVMMMNVRKERIKIDYRFERRNVFLEGRKHRGLHFKMICGKDSESVISSTEQACVEKVKKEISTDFEKR